MNKDAQQTAQVGPYEELEERVSAYEKESREAGTFLRETAKWIIGGIAVAAGGVIAGTSLSSLGELPFGPRLYTALFAAIIGFAGLGSLFASALNVIVPPVLTLQDFAEGREMPAHWAKKIEAALKPMLYPYSKNTLKEFSSYLLEKSRTSTPNISSEERKSLDATRRLILSRASYELRRLYFNALKLKAFLITPVVALAFAVSAYAARPTKDDFHNVPVREKAVDINRADIAFLNKALATTSCLGPKLDVIVLGEWRSGMQDVVTVPTPSCPPVRFRLDQGRFSQAY